MSDATTQDIHVFAPTVDGTWPVVVALHGLDGTGADMSELATRLASTGTIVFAPTYRSDVTTLDGLTQASQDLVCGYRLARTTAPQLGGDLAQPLTVVGWSLGADFAVLGGLSAATGPSPDDPCPGDTPLPDVIVGISGCYYEHEGTPVTWFDDVSSSGNKSADIYLLAGDQDTTCPAWQSEKLASALKAEGYNVNLVHLTGADHFAPVFHEMRNGQFQVTTNDAAGQRAVQVILDAIDSRQHAMAKP
jgi:dienelactone hydrolase